MKKIFKEKLSGVGGGTKGFTLIELLVVISIIGLLSSVVLASLVSARDKAMDSKIVQDLKQFEVAQQLYFDTYGVYVAVNEKTNNLAIKETKSILSSGDLNIFSIKRAEAAYTDGKCDNFVSAANTLIGLKYLSSVPKHPKDNGADICYKLSQPISDQYVVAYGPLVSVSDKKIGVILGNVDTNLLAQIYSATEGEYPRNSVGGPITDLASAGDEILGLTNGTSGSVQTPKAYGESCSTNSERATGICGYSEQTQLPACSDGSWGRLCSGNDQCASGYVCDLESSHTCIDQP